MTNVQMIGAAKEAGHRYAVTDENGRMIRTGNDRNTMATFAKWGGWKIENVVECERRESRIADKEAGASLKVSANDQFISI